AVCLQAEQRSVVLVERVTPDACVVRAARHRDARLHAEIVRRTAIRRDDRIVRPAVERGPVVVIEGRDRQKGARTDRAKPRQIEERVMLALVIVDASGLAGWRVWNFIMILPEGSNELDLIGG